MMPKQEFVSCNSGKNVPDELAARALGGARALPRLTMDRGEFATAVATKRTRRQKRFTATSTHEAALVSSFDIAIEFLLGLLLVFSALAFGATEAWSQEIVIATCSACLLLLALKLAVQRHVKFVWTWAYVPIGLFIGLIVLQMVPLPARWIAIVSPEALSLRLRLLGVPVAKTTLSLDPFATRNQFQLPLCAIAIFTVVLNVYKTREQVVRLLFTVAATGGAVILLAAYQNISGSRMIYGVVPAVHANSGPFMNYGHYSQFTNLSVGSAFGLLLYQIELRLSGCEISPKRIKAIFTERRSWLIWLLSCEIVAGAITVLLSMSRMGAVSMISAGAMSALLIFARSRGKGPGTLILMLATIAFTCLLYVGFDSVYDRLETVRHVDVAAGGRLEILRDLRPLWEKFPLVGTGLGTHEFVFPMFDRSTITSLATFAENEYAQTMEEAGSIGLGIILFFLFVVLCNLVPPLWNPIHRIDSVAYGLLFGLGAAIIHSFSDFGQHVPAIAVLAASECALVLVLNRIRHSNIKTLPIAIRGNVNGSIASLLGLTRWTAVIALLVGSGVSLAWADEARASQAYENAVGVREIDFSNGTISDDAATEDAVVIQAEHAVSLQPRNVYFQIRYANHLWKAIAAHSQNVNGQQLTLSADSVAAVGRIVRNLKQARQDCPTFGPFYSFAGQLEKFVLDDPSGDNDIRKGAELTSYDANLCFLAAQIDASKQNWEPAMANMHRAVDLNDDYRLRVVDLLVKDQRPDMAVRFAAGRRDTLVYLSNLLGNDTRSRDLSTQLRSDAIALLKSDCQNPDASALSLVELGDEYQNEKNYAGAIEVYRRALDQDYGQVDWRLRLADALAKANRSDEAIHEAKICLQLRQNLKPAEDIIAELSMRPGSTLVR